MSSSMACRAYRKHDYFRLLPKKTSSWIAALVMSMLIGSAVSDYGLKPKSSVYKHDKQTMLSTTIGIQGGIYCRSGTDFVPLKGAQARISCLAIDKRGYETAPFSILSKPTDANGYFLATLSPSEVLDSWRLSECKAFLHSSPDSSCTNPTDVNRGMSGARLSSYALKDNGKMKLYSAGPFVYSCS